MEKNQISPEKITKPIQLLGAWLVGLLTIDSAFLIAASKMESSTWYSGALVIAAIINVPIFIGSLFLLQTKFRPELQEDSYYSTYLNSRTNEPIKIPQNEVLLSELEKRLDNIERNKTEDDLLENDTVDLSELSYAINVNLKNREDIISKLNELNVVGFSEFGQKVDPPETLKIAITEAITKDALSEILKIAGDLGFTHYGFIEHFEEIEDDILFGAYGGNMRRITSTNNKT